MNNEKLVDAIGMLDDKLIAQAKAPKPRTNTIRRIIAAVLIVALIPVGMSAALFGGMFMFGTKLEADSAAPMYRYELEDSEILALNEQPVISENYKYSGDSSGSSDIYGSIDNTSDSVGSVAIEIHYADENRVIFTAYNAIFVHYRSAHDYIELSFSTEKMGIPGFNQGDKTTFIEVDKSGEYALLKSSNNMSQAGAKIDYHILNFYTGELTKIKKYEIPEDFEKFELSNNSYIENHDDLLSTKMASYSDENGIKYDCYISVSPDDENGYIIGNAELVVISENKDVKTYDLFK